MLTPMRLAAAILVLLMFPLAGCAPGGGSTPSGDTVKSSAPSPTETPEETAGGPYLPCELLTKATAETVMAHPSTEGEPMAEGDISFCIYKATSGPNFEFSFAVLTVYPTRELLDESTSFYDLTEVDGVAEWAALSIPHAQIAVADSDLYMNVSYSAGRICDDIIDSEARKAACFEEMRVGLLALAAAALSAAGH